MKRLPRIPLALILGLAFGVGLWAADAPPAPVSDKDKAAARRDTLAYGIDSDIVDLLRDLASEKEEGFNGDILKLFRSTRSVKLKSSILDFYSQEEWKGAEDDCLAILKGRDQADPALVVSSLSYLAQIKSKASLALAKTLLDEGDKKLVPVLIRLLGRTGAGPEEDLLIAYLDKDEATDDLKQAAIKALGDIGSAKSAERLGKLLGDTEAGKATRMAVCEALGKIGSKASVKPLIDAANGEDINVRASAVTALASFEGKDAAEAILSSLRDSAVQVRLAGCKAVGTRKLPDAVPALAYKVANDPEKAVKAEAQKALGAIGSPESFASLQTYFETPKNDTALRISAFGILARKSPAAIPALATRLKAEAAEKDRSFYTGLARELASSADCPAALPLARVLLGDSDYLIRLGGLEWMRRNKDPSLRPDLEALVEHDPSDYIKTKAKDLLASLDGKP